MGVLTGLEGVKKKQTECEFLYKAKDLETILRKRMAATMAGDNGAINIWKDDAGVIRCERMVYMRLMETKKYKTIAGATRWAEQNLKKIK